MATASQSLLDQKLNRSPGKIGMIVFGIVLVIGVGYAGQSLLHDLAGVHNASILPYVLLGIALLVALGFEFVNGFHDTANAVATVIYTHSLEPHIAVVWSGFWNFLLIAGRADFAGREQGRVRHGVRPACSGDYLESWDLVLRPAGFEFAHLDRFHYRSRHCQSADVPEDGYQRRGLGASHQYWKIAVAVASGRIRLCVPPVVADESGD